MSNFSESFELIFVNEARSGAILIAETSCLTFYWAQLTHSTSQDLRTRKCSGFKSCI